MRRWGALVAALALAGCQEGGEVAVTGDAAAPTFEIAPAGLFGGSQLSIRSLTVSRLVEGGPIPADSSWRITANDCVPVRDINYGEPPEGFRTDTVAMRLEPDQLYSVSFSGCGTVGGAFFIVTDGRIVAANGLGDAPRQRVIEQAGL